MLDNYLVAVWSRGRPSDNFFFLRNRPPPEFSPLPLHAALPIFCSPVVRCTSVPATDPAAVNPGKTAPPAEAAEARAAEATIMALAIRRALAAAWTRSARPAEIGRAHV